MTRKQMGVIYRAFKEGKLEKTTDADISRCYQLVDKLGDYDFRTYHRDAYEATLGLKRAVDAIFSGDYQTADSIVWGFDTVLAAGV